MPKNQFNYIPSDEFENATEQDFVDIEGDIYAEEDRAGSPHSSAESFLRAVEQSRLLTVDGEQFLFKRLNFLRFRANALEAASKGKRKSRKTQREIDRLLEEASLTREQIACANLRLATSIVRKHAPTPQDFDEMLAEANAILLNAIDKFDYSRGFRFSTYATHAIQRHTFRFIDRQRKRQQREHSNDDVVSREAVAPVADDSTANKLMNAVETLMSSFDTTLDEREQLIVRERFGLGGKKGKSMRAIGDEIGLSKERVRQILNESVEKLAKVAGHLESVFNGE